MCPGRREVVVSRKEGGGCVQEGGRWVCPGRRVVGVSRKEVGVCRKEGGGCVQEGWRWGCAGRRALGERREGGGTAMCLLAFCTPHTTSPQTPSDVRGGEVGVCGVCVYVMCMGCVHQARPGQMRGMRQRSSVHMGACPPPPPLHQAGACQPAPLPATNRPQLMPPPPPDTCRLGSALFSAKERAQLRTLCTQDRVPPVLDPHTLFGSGPVLDPHTHSVSGSGPASTASTSTLATATAAATSATSSAPPAATAASPPSLAESGGRQVQELGQVQEQKQK